MLIRYENPKVESTSHPYKKGGKREKNDAGALNPDIVLVLAATHTSASFERNGLESVVDSSVNPA